MKSTAVCLLVALVALFTCAPAAHAQNADLNILVDSSGNPIWLMDGSDTSINERGYGTPTVVWDPNASQYVMFYETKLSQAYLFNAPTDQTLAGLGLTPSDYDDCRLGQNPAKGAVVWAIGRATSPNGFTWSVDTKPVLIPAPGTYYACQAAQPIVRLDSAGHWYMWFKAMQWNPNNTAGARVDPCYDVGDTGTADTGTRDWPFGCTRVTGIGYASSTNGVDWTPSATPAIPTADILAATPDGTSNLGIGYPRVVRLGDMWHMTITVILPKPLSGPAPGDIYQATSTVADSGWTVDSTPALVPGAQSWAQDRVSFGSTWCENSAPAMHVVYQGLDLDPTTSAILEQNVGAATSFDASTWFLSQFNPMANAADVANWDQWGLLEVETTNQLLVWYAARPDGGGNTPRNIGFATTGSVSTSPPYASWDKNDLDNRFCAALPGDTGTTDTGDTGTTDTGDTADTADTADTGDTADTADTNDTGDTGDTGQVRGGCNCTTTPSGPAGGAMLLPLLALAIRRRRRRI